MKKNKKGFTLVELMVVIVIIGILAALAIPKLLAATSKAKFSEFKPTLKTIFTLQETYYQEQGKYPATASTVETDAPVIGFKHPAGGNFGYVVLNPSVSSNMKNIEVGTAYTRAGKSMKTSDGTVVGGTAVQLVSCVDGDGTAYAVNDKIANDAGNILVDACTP